MVHQKSGRRRRRKRVNFRINERLRVSPTANSFRHTSRLGVVAFACNPFDGRIKMRNDRPKISLETVKKLLQPTEKKSRHEAQTTFYPWWISPLMGLEPHPHIISSHTTGCCNTNPSSPSYWCWQQQNQNLVIPNRKSSIEKKWYKKKRKALFSRLKSTRDLLNLRVIRFSLPHP